MEKRIFTRRQKYFAIILGVLLLSVLAGCSGDFSPIDGSTTGFFNEWIVYPFSLFIKWLASVIGGSYGWSIIIITILLRAVIAPFMYKQQKEGKASQAVMKEMKPEMDALTEKYKGKNDPESMAARQQEMMELYQKYDFNPGRMLLGCLPLLIQMPVLIGFYYAIRRTPEIAESSFLWFNLGETNMVMAIIAIVIYFIQARVSLLGMDEKQQSMMKMMMFISPLMIGFISFVTPAALPLYWAVGGIIMIIQTLVFKALLK